MLELRPMLYGQEHLVDYRCDSGNRFDVSYYHAGVSRRNPRGRSNSTGTDIGDLVAIAHVSIDKMENCKSKSYKSYGRNPTPFRRGRCIEGKA